ncbi:MAG: hypothetical protein F6K30_07830 [Cyanothece sp. SIO2G6]|nr:hypothetical protein [Cyanothece sp. SIO2G6]
MINTKPKFTVVGLCAGAGGLDLGFELAGFQHLHAIDNNPWAINQEYARLQTFPDTWEFIGGNKRDIHQQIGNAVPVEFARKLAKNIYNALVCIDTNQCFSSPLQQLTLF